MFPCTNVSILNLTDPDLAESVDQKTVFPNIYASRKAIVNTKIKVFEKNAFDAFVLEHPSLDFAKSCLERVPPQKFWSISSFYPDRVCRLHVQVRLLILRPL